MPYYNVGGGNATRIYTRSGQVLEDDRSPRWVLKVLARHFGADLEALRTVYGRYLGCTYGVPVPLTEGLVLVPLRMRRVIGENDGANGYVNIMGVKGVKPLTLNNEGQRSCVVLEGDIKLPCLLKHTTADKKIRLGKLAYERYLNLHGKRNRGLGGAGWSTGSSRGAVSTGIASGASPSGAAESARPAGPATVREEEAAFGPTQPEELLQALNVLVRFIKN